MSPHSPGQDNETSFDALQVDGIVFQAMTCEVLLEKGVPKSNKFGKHCARYRLHPTCRVGVHMDILKVLRSPGMKNPALFNPMFSKISHDGNSICFT